MLFIFRQTSSMQHVLVYWPWPIFRCLFSFCIFAPGLFNCRKTNLESGSLTAICCKGPRKGQRKKTHLNQMQKLLYGDAARAFLGCVSGAPLFVRTKKKFARQLENQQFSHCGPTTIQTYTRRTVFLLQKAFLGPRRVNKDIAKPVEKNVNLSLRFRVESESRPSRS